MTPELRTAFAQLFVAPDRTCLIQSLSRRAGPDSPISPDDALQRLWNNAMAALIPCPPHALIL